jgi:hypothetical protein
VRGDFVHSVVMTSHSDAEIFGGVTIGVLQL